MKNRIKKHTVVWTAAILSLLAGTAPLQAEPSGADAVYHNGRIYPISEDFKNPRELQTPKTVEVVATRDGKIIFTGSKADAETQGLFKAAGKVVNLKGKTMLPGFVDGHGHFPAQGSADMTQVNLNSPPIGVMSSIKEYITALENKAANTEKDCLVQGWGYDDTLVTEQRHPRQEELNLSTGHPVLLSHTSEHISAANSKAIENAGLNDGMIEVKNGKPILVKDGTEYPGVDISTKADGSYHIAGVFRETAAMSLLTNKSPSQKIENSGLKSVARASQIYVAAGVTTADQGGAILDYPVVVDGVAVSHNAVALKELQEGLAYNVLTPRVIVHPFGVFMAGSADLGPYQRMALGWTGTDYTQKSADSPDMGDDITSFKLRTPDVGSVTEGWDNVPADLPADRIFMGAWKLIYDGSNQGYTGFFKKPGYWDPAYGGYTSDHTGEDALTFGRTKEAALAYLKKSVALYHRFGDSVEVHTNGSAAAEHYVTAMEEAVAAYPEVTDTRDTAIHAQMMERQHIERLMGVYDRLDATQDMYEELSGAATDTDLRASLRNGELMRAQNFINSYFTNHAFFWGDRHLEIFMGPGRGKNMNPGGWSMAYNQMSSFHNDTKVTPISPLRSLQSAVERVSSPTLLGELGVTNNGGTLVSGRGHDLDARTPYAVVKNGEQKPFWDYDQRVNVLQALHGITIIPAYQNHLESKLGSIEPGKFADFTILDEDPFNVAPSKLAAIRVATTVVNDTPVYGMLPDADSFVGQLAAGYEQVSGVSVTDVNVEEINAAEADKNYASLPQGEKRLGTFSLTSDVAPAGSSALYMANFLGNDSPVGMYHLYGLTATQATPYTYGRPDSNDAMKTADGRWWATTMEAPSVPLDPTAKLDESRMYILFFTIADDGLYDQAGGGSRAMNGKIGAVVALSTTGSLPENSTTGPTGGDNDTGGGKNNGDNSGGGCTVGGTPSQDLLVLLLGFSAVVAFRALRRRKERQ